MLARVACGNSPNGLRYGNVQHDRGVLTILTIDLGLQLISTRAITRHQTLTACLHVDCSLDIVLFCNYILLCAPPPPPGGGAKEFN